MRANIALNESKLNDVRECYSSVIEVSDNVLRKNIGLQLPQEFDSVMSGISSYVISLVNSLPDFSISISVVFLVPLYSIRDRCNIFATSFRIRLIEEAQGLLPPGPPDSSCPPRLGGCTGSLCKNS